jgi:Spy/CpxP family protein refolding chaperone
MKRNLLTVAAAVAIVLGGLALVQADSGHRGGGGWHGHRTGAFALEHLTDTLNLTADQQAKVQPIIDQAKPQIIAIHQDAMQKTHAVMDDTMGKIRPLLTPEQQKKFDDLQKAHQEMRDARQKMHDAMKE